MSKNKQVSNVQLNQYIMSARRFDDCNRHTRRYIEQKVAKGESR